MLVSVVCEWYGRDDLLRLLMPRPPVLLVVVEVLVILLLLAQEVELLEAVEIPANNDMDVAIVVSIVSPWARCVSPGKHSIERGYDWPAGSQHPGMGKLCRFNIFKWAKKLNAC